MYYHPKKRLVYLAHPRTASVATAQALQRVGFLPSAVKRSGRHHDPLDDERQGWRVLTTVRNAWDAAVSWVFFRCKGEPPSWDLDTFKTHLGELNHYIRDGRMWWHLEQATRVLRFERLEGDLADEVGELGLPRVNVSADRHGRHYRDFYMPETRDFVGELFAPEIAALGQAF